MFAVRKRLMEYMRFYKWWEVESSMKIVSQRLVFKLKYTHLIEVTIYYIFIEKIDSRASLDCQTGQPFVYNELKTARVDLKSR